jgi:Concanavalin A-like lectin/glucanases superfamily
MYTLKTGSWNDITVWSCGRVPTSTDIITVKTNHFITIPASYTANAKNVIFEAIGGKFIYAANTSKICLSCPATIPTNGLMIHLPFNGNANDASGNNNNGVVTGATLGNDRFGVANKAYRFNDGNRINVTNSASLNLSNAFSVSVWVNMQSTTGRDGNGAVSTTPEQCLFTKNCDNGQLRNAIFPQADGSFILQTWANTGDQITIPFQLNQWKLISLTYDGSTLKQFVDGNLVSTKAVVLSLALSNNYNLVIGNMGCWVYYFNGFMDEFRMYNRGLSNAEVLDIYNAEKP